MSRKLLTATSVSPHRTGMRHGGHARIPGAAGLVPPILEHTVQDLRKLHRAGVIQVVRIVEIGCVEVLVAQIVDVAHAAVRFELVVQDRPEGGEPVFAKVLAVAGEAGQGDYQEFLFTLGAELNDLLEMAQTALVQFPVVLMARSNCSAFW